jgi:L-lactate dehydrogenase (cytochrome)
MFVNIQDLRLAAKKRLPRAVFDFVDGGAEDEVSLRANCAAFRDIVLRPRTLVDVSSRDQRTTVLGQPVSAPLILAPVGLCGIVWPRAEIEAARAAGKAGLISTLSTVAACSIEEVAAAATGPLWFQLYVLRDRGRVKSLLERAKAAGYKALCVTADVPTPGQRERDVRNGMTIPMRITPGNVVDAIQRVGWWTSMARTRRINFQNFLTTDGDIEGSVTQLAKYIHEQFDPSLSWKDVEWIKSIWGGPMALKGVMTAEDARIAVEHGFDAVIVSNHGGRQLDGLPSGIEVLPEVVDAVGDRVEVILDGGVRRGSDVVKAIAMGARACMVGRPYVYGLAARGREGAERAIEILVNETDRALALTGCPVLTELNGSYVSVPDYMQPEPRPVAAPIATPISIPARRGD